MKQRIEEAVVAAFIADALSLGVHWVYETSDIEQKYGRLEKMIKPELVSYHQFKEKGDFTHYGDQMLVLLESVRETAGFDLNHFSQSWQDMFISYTGYMDHATKVTCENFKSGKSPEESGSQSMDLAGAVRVPPLLAAHAEDLDKLIAAARQQTAMTHNQPDVINISEWLARTSVSVLNGEKPSKAMFVVLDDMQEAAELTKMVEVGFDSRSDDTRETILNFGQMCSFGAALPSAVHLVAKYENDFKEAMIENIMAGGDSSARGILSGFLIGCQSGQRIPDQWRRELNALDRIKGIS